MLKTALFLKITKDKSYSDACLIAGIFYLIGFILIALSTAVFVIYNAVRSSYKYITRKKSVVIREGRREKRMEELKAQREAIMRGDPLY